MAKEMSKEEFEFYESRLRRMNLLPGCNWPQKFEFHPQGSSVDIVDLDKEIPDDSQIPEDTPYSCSRGIKVYDFNNL